MAELMDRKAFLKEFTEEHQEYFKPVEAKAVECIFDALMNAPTTTEAEIRAKAYTEVVEKLELELSESLIWGMLVDCSQNKTFDYTSEKIFDYVIETAMRVAEQLKERE